MQSGLGCSCVLLGHKSVPTVCPGSGQAHTTPWFLASLASLAQSSLILRLTAALLLLCQIRNVWLPRSGRCSQKQVGGQLCFSDRTLQILPPGKICLQLRHHGLQLRNSHVAVPDMSPWGALSKVTFSQTGNLGNLHPLRANVFQPDQRVKCNTLDQMDNA